ncbi:hypothetical protein EV421DRAFT_1063757 [Armillaria borealis]|uniref:Uncharacterized protein n=1 Tax=Armillaria borealis TaxID=47425 RepID=A0AA39MZP0_9AGAR|nr:hypothetical protein EV421DRAFT_1063757 [Armillaria borealis]
MESDLASYFDRSAKIVHAYADRIEYGYARPGLKTARELLNEHPIPFVFFLFFSLLSVFPVLLFLGCSVLVTLSFVLFALSSALLASGVFIFTFGASFAIFLPFYPTNNACLASILIVVLFMNVCIAALPTIALFSAYSVIRFLSLTRSGGRAGAAEWVDETKNFFLHSGRQNLPVKEDDENNDAVSNASAGSMVVVENKEHENTAASASPQEPSNGFTVKEEG